MGFFCFVFFPPYASSEKCEVSCQWQEKIVFKSETAYNSGSSGAWNQRDIWLLILTRAQLIV